LWLTIVGFGDFSGFGEISMKFVFFDVFANEVSAWLAWWSVNDWKEILFNAWTLCSRALFTCWVMPSKHS